MSRNILVITHTYPIPDLDGASVRIVRLMQMMHELGCEVTNLSAGRVFHPVYTERAEEARAFLAGRGINVPVVRSISTYLNTYGPHFDLILLGVVGGEEWLAEIRRAAPHAVIVFDTIELTFLSMYRAARVRRSEALAKQARDVQASQLRMVASADYSLVVTAEEQRLLQQLSPSARVRVLSNVHTVTPQPPGPEGRAHLLFVGNFVHIPNRDGVQHFVADIWPRLRQELSGVRFQIVGLPVPEIEALAAADVEVVGHVPSVEPYYHSCRLAVAPLRFGAGIKGKVLEAMGFGVPVVMTPVAAEGTNAVDGVHALIAATPGDFVERAAELYRNEQLWRQLSTQGQALVESGFSYEAIKAQLAALLAEVWAR
ncbi:MAG: glycosyltransferase [Caldilineaceae bacterium]|nr:glycosyltransferase [Caldilineaceae bacterium]